MFIAVQLIVGGIASVVLNKWFPTVSSTDSTVLLIIVGVSNVILIRDLKDDYYEFDERNCCLIGRRRHNKYQLGDAMRIKLASANLDKKQLDFVPAE